MLENERKEIKKKRKRKVLPRFHSRNRTVAWTPGQWSSYPAPVTGLPPPPAPAIELVVPFQEKEKVNGSLCFPTPQSK